MVCIFKNRSRLLIRSVHARVKPRANGRNIVDQQLPTLLDVTCRVRLHTLLHVVVCFWELLRKVWNRSNVQLRATDRNNSQYCWANNVESCCVRLHLALLIYDLVKTRLLVLASRLRRTLLPPSLDRKRRSSKRKWERSNSSDYDSFDPMTPARLPLASAINVSFQCLRLVVHWLNQQNRISVFSFTFFLGCTVVIYSQTPLYGHPLNMDSSLLRTVCFVPGIRKPLHFL